MLKMSEGNYVGLSLEKPVTFAKMFHNDECNRSCYNQYSQFRKKKYFLTFSPGILYNPKA